MANSITDVFAALQNGVIALGKFQRQLTGSFNNISAQLGTKAASSAVLLSTTAYVTTIAGNSSAFTLNGTTGITNAVNDIQLSQGSSVQFGAVKVDATSIAATAGVISFNASPITKSTTVDIALNNTATYFDGPSIAQGSSGKWWASGTVTLTDTSATIINCKLWDGTTVINTAVQSIPNANNIMCATLSGFITSPAGNLRISVNDTLHTTGTIKFNASGSSQDSTLSAIRIG